MAKALVLFSFAASGCGQPQVPLALADQAWSPPATTLDSEYVRVAKAMLGNGLADPRGGRFGEFRVLLAPATGVPATEQPGRGWLMPGGTEAVDLGGVRYSIVARSFSPTPIGEIFSGARANADRSPRLADQGIGMITIATPALLLLVGRPDLAESCQFGNQFEYPAYRLSNALFLRYQMLAAQALIDGDNRAGLHWSELCWKVLKVREKESLLARDSLNAYQFTQTVEWAEDLHSDFQRRISSGKPRNGATQDVLTLPIEQRIPILIDQLDGVSVRQWSQPGGVDFSASPEVQALIAVGEPAVPALIDTIGSDRRFTRSVSFVRDFMPYRSIQPVRNAAWAALTTIWPESAMLRGKTPKEAAVALRTEWSKDSGLAPEDRRLRHLRDDLGNESSWMDAARLIVKPTAAERLPSKAWVEGHRSEVSHLLATRAGQLIRQRQESTLDVHFVDRGLQLAHLLALWAGASSKDALVDLGKRAARRVHDEPSLKDYWYEGISGSFGLLTSDALSLGDHSLLGAYESVIGNFPTARPADRRVFKPLWEFTEDRFVSATAHRLMHRVEEALTSNEQEAAANTTRGLVASLVVTPMITVPAYRQALASGLKNTTEVHSVAKVRLGRNASSRQLSAADILASQLQRYHGAPLFVPSWTPQRREAARTSLSAWLLSPNVSWKQVAKDTFPYFAVGED